MLRRSALALVFVSALTAQKRPLTHADYDSWRHIQNQQISNDGRYLAYALFPQEGDGELILRDLVSGKEQHEPIGELPPPPPPNYADPNLEDTPPTPPGVAVRFSNDNRTLIFTTFPAHADIEKAKRDKAKPEDKPKSGLVIIDLPSGKAFRSPRVKNFQIPLRADGFLAYLHEPDKPAGEKPAESEAAKSVKKSVKKIDTGGDLVLRSLRDGAERTFPGVTEYTLTKDAQLLVYAVMSRKEELNGVFKVTPGNPATPVALLAGKGQYLKLAWNDDQTRLAFLSSRDDASSKQPLYKLYSCDKQAALAHELVTSDSPGFRAGWIVSEKGPISIAKSGNSIFFGTAPKPAPETPPDPTPADERVSVDLWHWNDDFIQPMQKVRALTERSRSYRAVYQLAEKKFIQLADLTMTELTPSEDGSSAVGGDDREYRRIQEYDTRYQDTYLVDTATGARKLVAKKHTGRVTWSPDGKYAIYFDGKDWISVSVPDGLTLNLTEKLGVSFGREDYDQPGRPESYGQAGWTKDGKYVLLYDRYDIWQIKPGGTLAINLTQGTGRKSRLVFRAVRLEQDPAEKSIDPAKPLLLRAENDDTHDSGFYRMLIDKAPPPARLVMNAVNFTPPLKARDVEVYALSAATFSQYPDLLVTDGTFRKFRKASTANPQMTGLSWGTAELMPFKSVDGVALQSTLYKPDNFDPHKKYPLLVYIYERLSQGVHTFVEPRPMNSINVSYYVSNGYVVLEPDIAYKTGYPGQSALNCVLPAIQEVVNKGFIDEKSIGIQGHSWGGYQIAYMVTRTNRFRAAAAGAPVANMISAYDGIRWGPGIPRQFQYERTQSRIGGSIWEFPLRYIENSPIFMADRVNTPLLMIHNDADDAVPWYQGIEYFLALRRLNKEVYMFTYNGEPHNLRRRPNQKDYAIRLQQYFDYYLKGATKPDWMEHGVPFTGKPEITATDSQ